MFPLGSSEPPPLILHVHPLRLTLGLAPFGGWGSLCFLCICGRGGSPQPRPWRPSSFPGGGVPEDGVCRSELLMTCESSKARKELISRIGTFPLQSLLFWCFRVCTAHLSGACEQVASTYHTAAERPVVRARLPLPPSPFPLWCTPPRPLSPLVDTLLFTVLSFSSQALGSGSEESPEGRTGAFLNESNHKVLLEILCSLGNVCIS